jgi:hypothetical protein
LITQLDVSVIINAAGDGDGGQLFAMVVLVLVFSAFIVLLRKQDLLGLLNPRAFQPV